MNEFIHLSKYAKNLSGQRFGRLVAHGPVGRSGDGKIMWLCQCDCGNQVTTRSTCLCRGDTQSCGCLQKERAYFASGKTNTTHGMSYDKIYATWGGIKARCLVRTSVHYDNYGGRGISMHGDWVTSFEMFYDYASSLPGFGQEGKTLDRINNNGNYEPGNVRWATPTEQQRNTRHNRMITHNDKTQCLAAWAEETGINRHTIRSRIERGWSIEKALGEPPDPIQ